MFQIATIDGTLRTFRQGEIRARKEIRSIEGTHSVTSTTEAASPALTIPPQSAGAWARYQTQQQTDQPHEVLFAHQIMSAPVFSVLPSTSIRSITEIFAERRYRHIPITSQGGALVGLISDRDLLRFRATITPRDTQTENSPVSSIMVSDVLTATPDTLIREVAHTMFEERIGSLPIVNSRNTPVGIVTRSDIVRALIMHGPVRLWA